MARSFSAFAFSKSSVVLPIKRAMAYLYVSFATFLGQKISAHFENEQFQNGRRIIPMTGYYRNPRSSNPALTRWHLSPNLTIFKGSNPRKQLMPWAFSPRHLYWLLYLAAGEGFEPSHTESESAVLPLHNPAKSTSLVTNDSCYYTHFLGFVKSYFEIFIK